MTDFTTSLAKCPPGLFMHGRVVCLKTEYMTKNERTGFHQSDAYVVDSGEYFWGGAKHAEEREELRVTQLQMDGNRVVFRCIDDDNQ